MSVPIFHEMLLPILRYAADGEDHRFEETSEYVAAQFHLTERDKAERLSTGQPTWMNRVNWAVTYLRKSGLIESVARGVFRITDRGRKLVDDKPKSLGLKDLEKYPEYRIFKGRKVAAGTLAQDDSLSQETPEEALEKLFQSVRDRLEGDLLDALKTASPTFFEKVVLSLLVAMGYGGTIADAASTTKRTGDDGIDGVIKEDRLGLDLIHIQAKRWNGTVGRPEIQNFAGSLEGQRSSKGVFITTSTFSAEARDYVSRIQKKIILIDGSSLAKLCVDFGVGVLVQTTYTIKKLDSDFFVEQ